MSRVAHICPLLSIFALLLLCTSAALTDDSGITPPNVDISPLETRVLGQSSWIAGSHAGLRIIVTNHMTGSPVPANVRLTLAELADGKPGPSTSLMDANTDGRGTIESQFQVPRLRAGAYQLTVDVTSRAGTDQVIRDIDLHDSQEVLLTCDKPVYQPGQVIHLRCLALDLATRKPASGETVTFEVEDARANKVFKQQEPLSVFGIAGTDFQLADEVNMGTFTLRALLSNGTAEKKVTVEQYVLPKFKIDLTTDKPYYLPGATTHGSVKCAYFFGKPVAHARVHIAVDTIDIGTNEIGAIDGETDAAGACSFDYQLPNSFVGQPLDQGKATVEFAAHVTDTTGHTEHNNRDVPVVAQPDDIAIVPESPTLVPGIENRVYIAAATADGTPLTEAALDVTATPEAAGAEQDENVQLRTDNLGIAVFTFTPAKSGYTVHVAAVDTLGRRSTADKEIDARAAADGIILRASETFAKVGDEVTLRAVSTITRGTIYFDVLRDGQTIVTRSEDVDNGAAQTSLPITADMTGTLQVHAYAIMPDENIIRDTRTLVVSPAGDLAIDVTADRDQYRPGDSAALTFSVTDRNHRPTPAALGLAIVDESVFALSELQPGLEKVYFALERDLMEPRYEIHGLSPVILLEGIPPGPRPLPVERQQAGAMLLSAVQAADPFGFRVDTYQQRWDKVKGTVVEYMTRVRQRLADAVLAYDSAHREPLRGADSLWVLVDDHYIREADLLDPWGRAYQVDIAGDDLYNEWFDLKSAGPDGIWGTADDIIVRPFIARPIDVVANRFEGNVQGFGGGGWMPMAAVPAPVMGAAPAMNGMDHVYALRDEQVLATKATPESSALASPEPRVRQYFPETLFWNPSLITDDAGHATLNVPLADSITTWRVSAMANSADGALGSSTAPVRVFQDFFADIDLPVALTEGDSVTIPVSLYNYLPSAQDVAVTLDQQPWFTLEGSATQNVHLDANQVSVVYFPITAKSIGSFTLKVTARGTRLSDAVQREIEVLPNGRRVDEAVNDRLDGGVEREITIPESAIDGASKLWIKLYPGVFSQVVEGLDGMLRMPSGCFEQTSSSTYPDVLVLSYLKQTRKINPELQMKAEDYINTGYQRLVTFECKSGGFSWFGNEPAHQVLTAYGLLEFSDMAKVHDVDAALILRTQAWLAGRQQGDGSWIENNQGIAEGIINRQTGSLRTTAYVAWALAESGYSGEAIQRGVAYVQAHASEATDPYTLAVILNLYTVPGAERFGVSSSDADSIARRLIALARVDDKTAYWVSDTQTFTGAVADGADLETTGLAAYGLLKYGREAGFVDKVLTDIVKSKDSFGTWETTQGTVWYLKSLLYAGNSNASGSTSGTVDLSVNGTPLPSISISPDTSDVMRQIDAGKLVKNGANSVKLSFHGTGSLFTQIATRYYLPWAESGPMEPGVNDILSLHVGYDRTTLPQTGTATATVTLHNNTPDTVEMPLIDIGVPPGFDVVPDNLDAAVEKGTISKYTIAARQVIIYIEQLAPDATVELSYDVRAKYPIKALTPASTAYPYYNPGRVATSPPQKIVVTRS
ncbi:MAG: alpha-2-macroglobulin family protein [Capsulimonadaceae bacterium]